MDDIVTDIESFLASGGEPMSDYFLDEQARLWFKGHPVLGSFTEAELRAIYGDNWQQVAEKIDPGTDLWKG